MGKRLEVDYIEYSTDALAKAAYPSSGGDYFVATNGTVAYTTDTITITYGSAGGGAVSGNFVPTFTGNISVKAWGPGGQGGLDSSNGGAGGGGGGYAASTVAAVSGKEYAIYVGAGSSGNSTTFGGTTVIADAGGNCSSTTPGAGGSVNTGDTTANGGTGGEENTTIDCSGGGGGAGGPDGAGANGGAATASAAGAGGQGDNGSGGAGGAAGVTGDTSGKAGTASVTKGGGGGGGGFTASTVGGAGGFPGGGGGGAESGTRGAGADGQVIITITTSMYVLSEGTIKNQGSYSLKVWADQTNSLNKTIIGKIPNTCDLTGVKNIAFDMYASRTGANVKFELLNEDTVTAYTSDDTYTAPATQWVNVQAWGAGGGGGSVSGSGGGGGGGGAYVSSDVAVTNATGYAIVAGTGGLVDTASQAENSTFATTTVVADAGWGVSSSSSGAAGVSTNCTANRVRYSGGIGGVGNTTYAGAGGGGAGGPDGAGKAGGNCGSGGATDTGKGGDGDNGLGGEGGYTYSAQGVNGANDTTKGGGGGGGAVGTAGTAGLPGGGGGGGTTGKAGANGRVVVTELDSASNITPTINTTNTWQTINWDISAIADADKDTISRILITITNADADNTFYLDNFRITQAIDVFGIC